MQTKIFYLKPRSAYNTQLKSDTFWGILCWGIRLLYGKQAVEDFIKDYRSDAPPFVLSSVFFYRVEEGQKIPFFPNPVSNHSALNIEGKPFDVSLKEANRHKTEKKLRYIKQADFEAHLNGTAKVFKGLNKDQLEAIKSPTIKTEMVTHNTIDRITFTTLERNGMGQLFHEDEIYLKDNNECGLYFLAKGPKLDMLDAVMRYLSHAGIGGNTSTGKGYFDITSKPFTLNEPSDANAQINLSLYQPTAEELQTIMQQPSVAQYDLVMRQGKTGGTHQQFARKKPLLYFKEGSVFPKLESAFAPGVVQEAQFVKEDPNDEKVFDPGHKIYQNGKGFMVNLKLN